MEKGSIVLCVDDILHPYWRSRFSKPLVRNHYYVVRDIIPNFEVENGPPGVAVEEIRGPMVTITSYFGVRMNIEAHFKMKRFREVLPPMDIEAMLEEVYAEPDLVPR